MTNIVQTEFKSPHDAVFAKMQKALEEKQFKDAIEIAAEALRELDIQIAILKATGVLTHKDDKK